MSAMSQSKREEIKARLSDLEAANGGRLTPEAVVKDAKSTDSPLHDCFEWNVKKAAHAHWLEQARALITSVMVVTRTEKSTVSTVFYVRDPSAGPVEQGYVSVETVRSDADMAREVLVREFSMAGSALTRALNLSKVLALEDEVEQLISGVDRLRSVVMVGATA
jgi:hypothetical protein